MEDSADWLHRLKIVGIDLRDPTQVIALADDVAAAGPLDILVNNACQTVRRSPGAYSQLVERESSLPAARRARAAGDGHLRPDLRGPPGRDRRRADARMSVAHHEGESAEHASRRTARRP